MLVHWIWFAHRPGLSDRMKRTLLQHFQDPEDIYFADSGAFDYVQELTPEAKEALADKNLTASEEILEVCQREKIHLLTIRDAGYPMRLKNIADPPVLLYYKGTLPELDGSPVIGIVGTRKASAYGLTTAKRMGYQIGRCGGIVVSGMAGGIDAVAMAGALTAGQTVVGVLGCGADIVYPSSNRGLFRDTEQYGCIFSEFAPGTPPFSYNFPKRNRIIAGLSCGVLVVEAPEKSGALITARQALDQGRDVFVVPGNIDVPSCVGSNTLLRDGAIPVFSGWDVISEYEALYPGKIRRNTQAAHQTAYPDEVERAGEADKPGVKVAQKVRKPETKPPAEKNCHKKIIDKATQPPYIDVNDKFPKLSADEQSIVASLRKGERLVDDVIAETGMSAGKLLAYLTMLELKGVIRRLPGKRISLK
ncbi:MAG: DNA-processing protein DprA [Faecousia sp.]